MKILKENIPSGWKSEDVVTVVCYLLSMASGGDVKWIRKCEAIKLEDVRGRFPQLWVACRIYKYPFYAFTSESLTFHDKCLNATTEFVNTILANLARRPYEEVKEYVHILAKYVECNSVSSCYIRAKLLTVLSEELIAVWKQPEVIGVDSLPKIAHKPEKTELIKQIESLIDQNGADILTLRDNESQDDYENRINRLKERMYSIIWKHVNKEAAFKSDLLEMFKLNGWYIQESTIPYSKNIFNRVKAFVDSRNSLVHSGSFAYERYERGEGKKPINFCGCDEHTPQHEYDNIVMMIPLMFSAMFGYEGKYRDILATEPKWNWILEFKQP